MLMGCSVRKVEDCQAIHHLHPAPPLAVTSSHPQLRCPIPLSCTLHCHYKHSSSSSYSPSLIIYQVLTSALKLPTWNTHGSCPEPILLPRTQTLMEITTLNDTQWSPPKEPAGSLPLRKTPGGGDDRQGSTGTQLVRQGCGGVVIMESVPDSVSRT